MYPYNFRPQNVFIDRNKVFVAMPFEKKYEYIYEDLVLPSIEKVYYKSDIRLKPYLVKDPQYTRTGWIDILENIYTSRIVIGVLTSDNPNVFYELGIAHATQQIERQLLIAPNDYKPKFDLKDLIYIKYDSKDLKSGVADLSNAIMDTLKLYDYENDRLVQQALSKLSTMELAIINDFYRQSHFVPTSDEDSLLETEFRLGTAFLCHAGLLRLSFKSVTEVLKQISYYWTDLGNSVLKKWTLSMK